MNTSAGIVTPGMSQSKSTTPCTSHATAAANSATATSRSRPAGIRRTRASAANSRNPSAPMPSAVPTIPVSARNCSGTLCGCRTSSSTLRYMRCVTGNEPAPQPPTGLSVHAPAASFHHTQRLPEFDEMIRFGSESLSWLVFVNSCQASSKNCAGPPFDVAIPSTTISASTPAVDARPRHTRRVLSSLHFARSSRRSIPHAAMSSPSRLPAMTRHRMIPSGVRSSSGTLIPFSAGRLNASASTGISATIVAPNTASPRSRCPPSSVMTRTAVSSATRPPREYVIPRHVSRRTAR